MTLSWHPSDEQLIRFITVEDDACVGEMISEHLEDCTECVNRLALLDKAREIYSIPANEEITAEVPQFIIENISKAVRSDHLPVSYPLVEGTQTLEFREFFDRGGMGDVLVYWDEELDRSVVLKTLRHDKSQSQHRRKRFSQEMRITSQLRLPGVPEVYGAGKLPDGRDYFCMQLIEGGKLSDHIVDFHHDNPKLVRSNERFLGLLRIFITICRTLESAHQQKIVHRDVKSSNVLLGKNNFPYVIDWGLAGNILLNEPMPQNDTVVASPRLSELGQQMGTPYSWSPEQAAGLIDRIDSLSDIYGLGSILFEILTGAYLHARASEKTSSSESDSRSPSSEKSEIERITSELLGGVVRDPRSINSSIPNELASICVRATEHKREDRYQSAGELADDLDAWIACLPVKAHRYNSTERLNRWIIASPSRAVTVLAGIVLIVFLSFVFSSVAYTLKKKAENNELVAQSAVRDGLFTLMSVINIANDTTRPDTDELREIQAEMVSAIEKGIENTTTHTFNVATRLESASLLGKLGDIYTENSQPQEALKVYSRAINLFDVMPAINLVANIDASIQYAELQCKLAVSFIACKQRGEASSAVERAISCLQSIPEKELAIRNKLSLSLNVRRMYAVALFRNWDRNTLLAHDTAREFLPFCDALLARWPTNDELKLEKAEMLAFVGLCVHKSGGFEKEMLSRYKDCSQPEDLIGTAQNYFDQALSLLQSINDETNNTDSYLTTRVSVLLKKALSDARVSQEQSRATYRLCLDSQRRFVDKYPLSREQRIDLAATLSEYADQFYPDNIPEAVRLRRESLQLLREFENSESPRIRSALSHITVRFARDLVATDHREEAIRLVGEIYDRYGTLHHGNPLEAEFLGYALIYSNSIEKDDIDQRENLAKLTVEFLAEFNSESILGAKDLMNWLHSIPECRALADEPSVRTKLESLNVERFVNDSSDLAIGKRK